MPNAQRRDVILLTGASTGIGLAVLKQLLKLDSFHVIATARAKSLARFHAEGITENEHLWLRPLDVTDALQREAVVNEAQLKLGGIDILINNAASAYRSVVEQVGIEERITQMGVNFRAPIELIRLVLPHMRQQKKGKIINLSSVAGMMAVPTMSVYSASKFALEGASEALWYEVRPWNISVTLVQPGFIRSDAHERVLHTELSRKAAHNPTDPYYRHYRYMVPFIEKVMRLTTATPEKVAKKVVSTLQKKRPPLRVSATIDAHLLYMARRLLPRSIYHHILYYALPSVRKWGKNTHSNTIKCTKKGFDS